MATRKVKPAPTEGKVTRKQAKAAVKAVMENKRDPGTILTNARLEELQESWKIQYDGIISKELVLQNILTLTDRILSGEIVPEGVDNK